MGEMIIARDAMAHAIDCARRGDVELGELWLDIARELREGSRPALPRTGRGSVAVVGDMGPESIVHFSAEQVPTPRPFERGSLDSEPRYEDEPVTPDEPDTEIAWASVDSDADTFCGYVRGQARPPSRTAYVMAMETRKRLDGGERPVPADLIQATSSLVDEILQREPKAELDETVVADAAFGPAGLQQVARALRSMDDAPPQRWVTGDIESDEQRLRRTPRPYVESSDETQRFDAFAAGRASVGRQQLEETRLLSAGDPTRCRNCDYEIRVDTEYLEAGSRGRSEIIEGRKQYVHVVSGQVICPTPPKHLSEQGDESYVTGPHTMAEPGGSAYRGQ